MEPVAQARGTVHQDVIDASNKNLLELTHKVAAQLDAGTPSDSDSLRTIMEEYDVAEINVIDENGFIVSTTMPEFMDYDMRSGEQSAEFIVILDEGEPEYVQRYRPISYDSSISRKYAAVKLSSGGFVQVGYDGERFQRDIDKNVISAVKNRQATCPENNA